MPVSASALKDELVTQHGIYLPSTPAPELSIVEDGLYTIIAEAVALEVNASGGGVTAHGDLTDLGWTVAGHTGTASSLAAFDGAGNPTTVLQSAYATAAHAHAHSSLTGLGWTSSGHTGTASYLAGFNGSGNPTSVDPATFATSGHNHAHSSLSSLAWSSSGHTGTASYLAGFDGSGNPTNVDPATVGGGSGATITMGTYSGAPGSPASGDLHIVTTTGILRRYNGSAWVDSMAGIGELTAPPTASWTKAPVGHASAVVTAVDGHLRYDLPISGAGAGYFYRAEPAATYEIEMAVRGTVVADWSSTPVILLGGWYNTGSGAAIFMYVRPEGRIYIQRDSVWGSAFHSNVGIWGIIMGSSPFYRVKIQRTATHLRFYWSHDGQVYTLIHAETIGSFITPDRVIGAGMSQPAGGSVGSYLDLLSWKVT
jgi:hypothetical protein